MRYIHVNGEPPKALLTKAGEVTKLLEAAKSDDERKAIIDKNRKVYRKFHDWLLKQSNGKCWFSDTDALFVHFDVEHYRPKKQAKDHDGTEREGYWWLAFDWKNLRICGNVGNRKKGAFFPLRDVAAAATSAARDIDDEAPYLLDPSCFRDTVIVEFNEIGKIVAAPHTNAWDQERLQVSVERYGLDFDRLEQARKGIWAKCQRLINQCQNQMKKLSKGADGDVTQYFERLGEMVNPNQPLSSVAISCLLASGLGWAQRIAVTQNAHDG